MGTEKYKPRRKERRRNILESLTVDVIKFFKNIVNTFYLFTREKVFNYLLLVIAWMIICAVLFTIVEHDQFGDFSRDHILDTIINTTYFSIITISTIGYGDYSPETPLGKALMIAISFFSIGAIALFTANLTSAFTKKKLMEGRGIMDFSQMRHHYVICGWKNNMATIIRDILRVNQHLKPKSIVIIAQAEPDIIEMFRQHNPDLAELNIMRGDFATANVLRLANVKHADKIIIFADETGGKSTSEIDSKTVLTSMTLSQVAAEVHICAELYDSGFESYLRQAHVDEIVYVNDYSRNLIANSIAATGFIKIINQLLNPDKIMNLRTQPIPKTYVGKGFGMLKQYYIEHHPKTMCIGILENVGSFYHLQREALKEAQKTPDITKLVDNLSSVKKLENNKPVLVPDGDYIVQNNALAIVIERMEVADES